MVANVLVEVSSKNIDKTFDYLIPDELLDEIKIGVRVTVPFASRTLEGFVLSIKDKSEYEDIKSIINVVDKDVVLNPELLELGKIMHEHTLSTLISCYQVMLPKALKAKEGTTINKKYDIYYELNNINVKLTPKEEELINLFNGEKIERKVLVDFSTYALNSLIKKGVLKEIKEEHYRYNIKDYGTKKYDLTDSQLKVVNEFRNSNDSVYLLYGVTGSGKTEVYMELIDDELKKNKNVIVLVPEISLTPQMIRRFSERFGSKIACLHSALSEGEKYDEWRKINEGHANIVIGARSALFAPLNNIGLIVIDEEQSDSYKQDDQNPKYSAIDMAIERAKLNNCKVIMGSATPRLESYSRAKKGVYHLLELPERINKKSLPEVEIVDLNSEFKTMKGHFSSKMIDAITERLERKEQVILLLNRRGYSSFVTCKNCGFTYKCPNCDISLTYHKSSNNLRCHYCGYAHKLDDMCPNCKEKGMSTIGVGTEKIEEELHKYIENARVLRMDFDTTSKKGAHERMIEDFGNHKYDILLGTQIVAKGLDFENVTLVGIINADTSLNIPDFRSSENTFSLLSQVSGRSGRSNKEGKVILQTFNKDHYAIKCAKTQNYDEFYNEEMIIRHEMKYPPYYYLLYVRIQSKDERLCKEEASKIYKALSNYLKESILLGPSVPNISKVYNTYRLGILIKYKNEPNLMSTLNKMIDAYKGNNKVSIDINFNPRNM